MTKPRSHKKKPAKTGELPGMTGPGVAPLSIPEIDKAVDSYERKKAKRCEASPGEIAAKKELRDLLVTNRELLPTDEDGRRFYRREGVDYIIEETLKRHSVAEESGSEPTVKEIV